MSHLAGRPVPQASCTRAADNTAGVASQCARPLINKASPRYNYNRNQSHNRNSTRSNARNNNNRTSRQGNRNGQRRNRGRVQHVQEHTNLWLSSHAVCSPHGELLSRSFHAPVSAHTSHAGLAPTGCTMPDPTGHDTQCTAPSTGHSTPTAAVPPSHTHCLSAQLRPSPSKPGLHAQVNAPAAFSQVALWGTCHRPLNPKDSKWKWKEQRPGASLLGDRRRRPQRAHVGGLSAMVTLISSAACPRPGIHVPCPRNHIVRRSVCGVW